MQVNPFPFKRPVRMEMVPLIDMFFLLLVFFIFGVFSMSRQQGIIVELPSARTGTSTQDETVTISIEADGTLFLEREPLQQAALDHRLREIAARTPLPLVVINAHRLAGHGVVIDVLDRVRQASLQRVSFQTEPAKDRQP